MRFYKRRQGLKLIFYEKKTRSASIVSDTKRIGSQELDIMRVDFQFVNQL